MFQHNFNINLKRVSRYFRFEYFPECILKAADNAVVDHIRPPGLELQQHKPRTNGPVMFLVRSRMLSLSFVQRIFYWDVGNVLSGEKGVGTGEKLLPSKCIKKAMISRITLRYLSTLDLTQTFVRTFH